ncbi:hypothetical protein [Corallococcus aberystwythensis]|uniref:hypothetical protein n=1 Tax=Corallococcus aberystwythensis TaxID=2316722 RepID=UPI00142EDEFD|nr:hypothetical protein [Corallococcus aberystwythensis]
MRFMIIRRADQDTEAGVLPDELELRQVYEDDDFGAEFTPALREQEARIREQSAKNR